MEAQLQQLAVNAGCSPRGVLRCHTKDQRLNLLAQRLSATELPRPGEPVPIQAKASAMPLHHGSRRDQKKRCFPSRWFRQLDLAPFDLFIWPHSSMNIEK